MPKTTGTGPGQATRSDHNQGCSGVRTYNQGGGKCRPPGKIVVTDAPPWKAWGGKICPPLDLKNALIWAKNKIFARFAPSWKSKMPSLGKNPADAPARVAYDNKSEKQISSIQYLETFIFNLWI